MATQGEGNSKRRDLLHQIEVDVQKRWADAKVFEIDAPSEKTDKFMVTFPYPYMNGQLHIGHAFSMSKAMFAAQFHRLLGKKVLFPFGFHCTGMPIQAAADKLKREYDGYGKPHPIFPPGRPFPKEKEGAEGVIEVDDDGLTLRWKPPASTGKKAIKAYSVLLQVGGGSFKEATTTPHPSAETLKANGGKVSVKVPIESGKCVYKVVAELADGSTCPESKESDEVSVDAAPKDKKSAGGAPGKRVAKKIQAKSGDAAFQWEILKAMGKSPEDMVPFTDPVHWLEYFPPVGLRDLKRFGCPTDYRRSFITTSVNPYYDSFVRWQFSKLKTGEKIGFGKRSTIFSELDGQACMDHDRAEGEGVAPQEYTAIKIEVVELPGAMEALKGKRVYLLAATLRAETMPGQTNCWILPQGTYGCFAAAGIEVYVCSHRSARNLSFQELLEPWGKPQCLLEVKGKELLGAKVKAPTCMYDHVFVLPLETIKMDKGTGVVTSVPSDSPDDYAAFMDMKKQGKREHYEKTTGNAIKAEWVDPFELVPIIDVEIDGEVRGMAAQYMCEKLGVQSQRDKDKLQEAHDVCYKLGFDKGTMSAGPCKLMPVKQAKVEFRNQMVKDGQAFVYSEPEKRVTSRSGDECVVAGIDQWYLKYGEEAWQTQIVDHIQSANFSSYNERIKESFMDAIKWLREWACSRSFGLGTKVPWDEQFVIESLSDSTIYMAYYTVAHFLQGDLNGSKPAAHGIRPQDLTLEVWDYVFLNGPLPKGSKIPEKHLKEMRREFKFWYPLDLRVSGKDLIQNHLTMALYNHAAVWANEPEMWPRGYFCHGWVLVNGEKMSKSKGNFFMLEEIIQKYSADAVRLALGNSGDTLLDANFDESVAMKALLSLPIFLDTMKEYTEGKVPLQDAGAEARFMDRWFANEMNRLLLETRGHYESMCYREALRTGYFEFNGTFSQYRDICNAGKTLPNKGLVMRYFEWQVIIFSPICPHICEHAWGILGKKGTILNARFPEPTAPEDMSTSIQGTYMFDKVPHDCIKLLEKAGKQGKPTRGTVYVARSFPEWKVAVLARLRQKHAQGKLPLVSPDDFNSDSAAKALWTEIIQELMQDSSLKPMGKHLGPFAAFKRDEAATFGISSLDAKVPFDELALLAENLEYLEDKLKLPLDVGLSEEPLTKDHQEVAGMAQPGKPVVWFAIEASGSTPGGAGGGKAAKAAGGGCPSGTKPGQAAARKGAAGVIKDLAKLNEHLSARSYVEGGGRPTAADKAQLEATPCVDAEKFPHAARWHRHISSFSALEQGRW